jgi:hypothetical protein
MSHCKNITVKNISFDIKGVGYKFLKFLIVHPKGSKFAPRDEFKKLDSGFLSHVVVPESPEWAHFLPCHELWFT